MAKSVYQERRGESRIRRSGGVFRSGWILIAILILLIANVSRFVNERDLIAFDFGHIVQIEQPAQENEPEKNLKTDNEDSERSADVATDVASTKAWSDKQKLKVLDQTQVVQTKEQTQQKELENENDNTDIVKADVTSTVAWKNVTTRALNSRIGGFFSGFRNQIMCFTVLVFNADRFGQGQVLLESIRQKDLFGSDGMIPFEMLWDIPHWNSHYPVLPRLVHHDPFLHNQWDPATRRWYRDRDGNYTDSGGVRTYEEPTRPHKGWEQHVLFVGYKRYSRSKGPFPDEHGRRNPIEILMNRGALRPHPELQAIIERSQRSFGGGGGGRGDDHTTGAIPPYLTLHARVEPDMQKHKSPCTDKTVRRLSEIFGFLEEGWPDGPPAPRVFMPINRKLLESEGSDAAVESKRDGSPEWDDDWEEHLGDKVADQTRRVSDGTFDWDREVNWIAVENLRALNRARDAGLWNGRARVVEAGADSLRGTGYAAIPATAGALVDFFLALGGSVFVGTEISSFSTDLMAHRFHRDERANYYHHPDGLQDWTPPEMEAPPAFECR